jgi:hypothetical protein
MTAVLLCLLAAPDAGTVAVDVKDVKIELVGRVQKKRVPGYLSPYRLEVTEPESRTRWEQASGTAAGHATVELELREGPKGELEAFVGKRCRLKGRHVFVPASKGEPGSEAASRFLGGMIPAMRYFEVVAIEPL